MGFIIGLFVGGCIGVSVMACLQINRDEETIGTE